MECFRANPKKTDHPVSRRDDRGVEEVHGCCSTLSEEEEMTQGDITLFLLRRYTFIPPRPAPTILFYCLPDHRPRQIFRTIHSWSFRPLSRRPLLTGQEIY